MKHGLPLLMGALLLITIAGCSVGNDLLENGEYKPAIMVDDQIYWLSPTGNVNAISEHCEVIGQIEWIASPTKPPDRNWEAIGFSDDFLGADIYQSEDGDTIYVYNPELKQYVPFELITE